MYHHSMSLPAQKPKPSFSEQPSLQLKESAAEYRGPKPSIPYLVHKDPSEFACLKLALHNLLPEDASELFKFQILVDHLQLEEAKLIADSFLNSPYPYTATMAALTEKFGKPHQLALSKIARVMDAPDVRPGDPEAFERFALQVQALVGLLKSLGPDGDAELRVLQMVAS
ncbi:guanine nucleotide-binding subunit alpha-12 isoform X2 [Labeo rohita]|uniref:Guanine nucleotide-binding subunit alpha-12 isoform X2 n=1 Tax=Labeo rohita TaxID=84645 RepID=A0A498NZH8_LABRO|nr:guanine nucleotide-binding subunit alpha-12 isoform X2 [Labeo rohita]